MLNGGVHNSIRCIRQTAETGIAVLIPPVHKKQYLSIAMSRKAEVGFFKKGNGCRCGK